MIRKIDSFFHNIPQINPNSSNSPASEISFSHTLKNMIQDVNNLQIQAKEVNEAFVRGELEDLHQVTLAQEKARIALELLLEIRNKLLEGYQEIMRMQI